MPIYWYGEGELRLGSEWRPNSLYYVGVAREKTYIYQGSWNYGSAGWLSLLGGMDARVTDRWGYVHYMSSFTDQSQYDCDFVYPAEDRLDCRANAPGWEFGPDPVFRGYAAVKSKNPLADPVTCWAVSYPYSTTYGNNGDCAVFEDWDPPYSGGGGGCRSYVGGGCI